MAITELVSELFSSSKTMPGLIMNSPSMKKIGSRVPHTANLDFFLFMFINDLSLYSENLKFLYFANDASLLIGDTNVINLTITANTEL